MRYDTFIRDMYFFFFEVFARDRNMCQDSRCVAVCCSVLLCATVCCRVLLCAAMCMHVTGICTLTHTKANVLFSKKTHTCHDSFTYDVHTCAMTHLYLWRTHMCHDSFTCDLHTCAMTHLYLWRTNELRHTVANAVLRSTRRHTCAMIHLHVMYIYVPWLTAQDIYVPWLTSQEWRNRTLWSQSADV